MEPQVQPVQPQALPPDVEAILQPQAAFDPLATPSPVADSVSVQAPVAPPVPVAVAQAPPAEPQVPLHVLLDERKERQAYQRQIQQFLEIQQRASQPPPPEPIDPDANPGDAVRFLAQQNAQLRHTLQDNAVHQRANTSEMIAREKFGDTAVDAAVAAAKQQGLGDVFMSKQRPYQELMGWHNTQTIAEQVGPDLKAWETRKEAEIRARVLAEMQQAAPARPPGASQVLPPSLSAATRANASHEVIADAGDFFKTMLRK